MNTGITLVNPQFLFNSITQTLLSCEKLSKSILSIQKFATTNKNNGLTIELVSDIKIDFNIRVNGFD